MTTKLFRAEIESLVRLEEAPFGLCQVEDGVMVLKSPMLAGYGLAAVIGEYPKKLYGHTLVNPVRLVEVGLHVEGEVE